MAMIAQARRKWDGRYELRFPFNKFLVESLKVHIPACYREYDSDTKTWIVDAVHASTAINLLRSVFPDADIDDRGDTIPPRSNPFHQSNPHAVLYVLPDAPRCVIDAAYKALSREIHPDRAGEQAHDANEAYAVLRDRVTT